MSDYADICSARFDADPDIAGPGALTSFIGTAFITTLVAMVPAYYEVRDAYYGWRHGSELVQAGLVEGKPVGFEDPFMDRVARHLLKALADLQLITGTSIVIAGLTQYPGISFYHSEFVISYWFLTLNSFWIAESQQRLNDDDYQSGRLRVRRFVTLCSVILHLSFYGLELQRENSDTEWQSGRSGHCYIYTIGLHPPQAFWWFWYAGEVFLALMLSLKMIPRTTKVLQKIGNRIEERQKSLWLRFKSHTKNVTVNLRNGKLLLSTSEVVGSWALLTFFAFWGYGKVPIIALQVLAYWGIFIWAMVDIVHIKVMNRNLLNQPEVKMGLGQVLAIGLMGLVVFNTLDAFREVRDERKRERESVIDKDLDGLWTLEGP